MVFRTGCVEGSVCGDGGVRRRAFLGPQAEELGLPVKLLPPKWVRAYVVNNKTDANDSVAIAEASAAAGTCGAGEVGGAAGSDDIARTSRAGDRHPHAVLQHDPLTPGGTGAGDRALKIEAG